MPLNISNSSEHIPGEKFWVGVYRVVLTGMVLGAAFGVWRAVNTVTALEVEVHFLSNSITQRMSTFESTQRRFDDRIRFLEMEMGRGSSGRR